MKRFNKSLLALALSSAVLITGCSDGDDGEDGAPGAPGTPGTPGESYTPVTETSEVTNLKFISNLIEDGSITIEFELTDDEDALINGLETASVYVAEKTEDGVQRHPDGSVGGVVSVGGDEATEGATLTMTDDGNYLLVAPLASVTADTEALIRLQVGGGDNIAASQYIIINKPDDIHTTATENCFACHVDYATTDARHAKYVAYDIDGEVDFVAGCMVCHNSVAGVKDEDNNKVGPGYASNSMQMLGHLNHQKFTSAFDVTNCSSCHTTPINNTDRGCVDCHGSDLAMVQSSDIDWRLAHSKIEDRLALMEQNAITAEITYTSAGETCNTVTAAETIDLEALYGDGSSDGVNGFLNLSTYLHTYDNVEMQFVNRALVDYKGSTYPKTVTFPSSNVMDICWPAPEPQALLSGDNYEVAGSVRLYLEDPLSDGKNVPLQANTHEVRNVMSDTSCTTCHNSHTPIEGIFQSWDGSDVDSVASKDHAHYGGVEEGGLGCIACHNSSMTRGVSAGFGPMIHDFHFGDKAAERAAYETAIGESPSAEKLNGANCVACHQDGIDLAAVPAFTMKTKAGVGKSPVSANCQACHSDGAAVSHMQSMGGFFDGENDNTIEAAESCAVCHSVGDDQGIDKYHLVEAAE
ncbi:multiheme c-type cytochrome [Ferrimonas lipolytica]|uniref:Cytochrome c domain-containing protein n=1 Tax=Ferrimonas lipolytica TaxID=2724191 RepID=A0A6H1UHS9_9GAMM|nr:hypothetical protein [Ferrimonas lipolytica]QIZ78665.1 hypothetical protein HER31_18225 [Ferrimonas lipolytica]